MKNALLLSAAAAAAATAVAVPAFTSAQTGGRTIAVHEKVTSVRFVRQHPLRGALVATGDRVLTRQALKDDAGKALGTLYTDCTNAGPKAQVFKAKLQCLSTYAFADGQVVASGVVTFSKPNPTGSITGGSGAYTGATGIIVTGAPGKGDDSVDVLHLG